MRETEPTPAEGVGGPSDGRQHTGDDRARMLDRHPASSLTGPARSEEKAIVGRNGWYRGIPPVTVKVDCGGTRHVVSWRRGRLVLHDHPRVGVVPPAAGEVSTCLSILDATRWLRVDNTSLRSLLVVPPAGGDLEAERRALAERQARMRREVCGPSSAPSRPEIHELIRRLEEQERERWRVAVLRSLPPELKRVIGLGLVAAFERRWSEAVFRSAFCSELRHVLSALALPAFEESVRRYGLGPDAAVELACRPLEDRRRPWMAGWLDASGVVASAALPLSWLTRVWGRGIEVVDGRFVLAVAAKATEGGIRALATRWEPEVQDAWVPVAAPALLRLGPRGWTLCWA